MRKLVVLAVSVAGLGWGCATLNDEERAHIHGGTCGHEAISHQGHIDYLHNGYMHSGHEGFDAEHKILVSALHPERCTPSHNCDTHKADHKHTNDCDHSQVPHGHHLDYLVAGHLHHPHNGHCDDHGNVAPVVGQ